MPIIHFPRNPGDQFIIRQTPKGDGIWEDTRFIFGTGHDAQPDWLLVQDSPPAGLRTRLPRSQRILLLTEPPSVRPYDQEFIEQFGIVISPFILKNFSGEVHISQSALPWFYGVNLDSKRALEGCLDFQDLKRSRQELPRKDLISVVCSTKTLTRNQVRRLRFLNMLKAELGDELKIFGRGFQRIGDKAEGLDDFRYHLVLENNLIENFWTEKLADPILGGCYPIAAGGGGLDRYFDPRGFSEIDITKPKAALSQVLEVLEADPVSNADVRTAMEENKRRLMEEHQIFPLIAELVQQRLKKFEPLSMPIEIHENKKSKFRYFTRPFRPLRPILNRLYLQLFEPV